MKTTMLIQKPSITVITTIFFVVFYLFAVEAKSQSQSLNNLRLLITPVNPIIVPPAALDSISSPLDLLTSTDSVYLKVTFEIDSITNISEFNVELGSDSTIFSLLNNTYFFDNATPGVGKSYKRVGKYIELGLGKFPFSSYYVKARYKNSIQVPSSYTFYQFIH